MTDLDHRLINQLVDYEVDEERLKKLEREQRPKTKIQRMKIFFKIFSFLGVLCQFLSALLSSTGAMYWLSQKLNSNGIIISIVSLLALLVLEFVKRFTATSFHAQRLDDKEIVPVTYVILFVAFVTSVSSTYWGTPHAVAFFSSSPIYHDLAHIKREESIKMTSDTSFWSNNLQTAIGKEAAFWTANKKWDAKLERWRLSSNVDVQAQAKIYAEQVQIAQISFDSSIIKGKENIALLIAKAEKENQQKEATHIAWCSSFGFSLSILSTILELLFFVVFWWTESYKRLEKKEGFRVIALREKGTIPESPNLQAEHSGNRANLQEQHTINQQPESRPVGFRERKEGDVITGRGRLKPRVMVNVQGQLKALTEGEINKLISGNPSAARIKHLTGLKNKLP